MSMFLKRTNRFSSIVMAVIIMVAFGFTLGAKVPADVSKSAEEGLSLFMNGEFPSAVFDFAEWQNPEIIFGFQVYTIPQEKLVSKSELQLHRELIPTGVWRFVIKTDNGPTALLTVARVDDKWTPVGIGALKLSKEVESVTAAWPEADGYNFRFIRLFDAKSDFMQVTKGPEAIGYVPFISARIALGMNAGDFKPKTLLSNSDVLMPLRSIFSKGKK